MRRPLSATLSLALLTISPLEVAAWGVAGHQIVATIAQAHLYDSTRAKVAAILPEWTNGQMAPVAAWADRIRCGYMALRSVLDSSLSADMATHGLAGCTTLRRSMTIRLRPAHSTRAFATSATSSPPSPTIARDSLIAYLMSSRASRPQRPTLPDRLTVTLTFAFSCTSLAVHHLNCY